MRQPTSATDERYHGAAQQRFAHKALLPCRRLNHCVLRDALTHKQLVHPSCALLARESILQPRVQLDKTAAIRQQLRAIGGGCTPWYLCPATAEGSRASSTAFGRPRWISALYTTRSPGTNGFCSLTSFP